MQVRRVRRFLFLTFMVQEGVIFRRAIRQERAHLASLQVRHRGIDSFIWSDNE